MHFQLIENNELLTHTHSHTTILNFSNFFFIALVDVANDARTDLLVRFQILCLGVIIQLTREVCPSERRLLPKELILINFGQLANIVFNGALIIIAAIHLLNLITQCGCQ